MEELISNTSTNDVSNFYLARQAIVDADQKVFAYQLYYRSEKSLSKAVIFDDLTATSTVIVNLLSQFGIDNVLDRHVCFINVSSSFLMNEIVELLPADKVVLEILEDVAINAIIIARCKALKEMGFKLAVNKFHYRNEYDQLLPILDFIKVNTHDVKLADITEIITSIKKHSNATIIAEGIELEAIFDACKGLGLTCFQGYYFEKPLLLQTRNPSIHESSLKHMIGMLIGEASLTELELEFKNNLALSLGLLRLAASIRPKPEEGIASLQQAIVVVGKRNLLHWIQLLLLTANEPDRSDASHPALSRARTMEILANHIDTDVYRFSQMAFMVGMFSLVDTTASPRNEVMNSIHLSEEIKDATLSHQGILGELLELSVLVEQGNDESVSNKLEKLGINPKALDEVHA